jgi:hypothetical protein
MEPRAHEWQASTIPIKLHPQPCSLFLTSACHHCLFLLVDLSEPLVSQVKCVSLDESTPCIWDPREVLWPVCGTEFTSVHTYVLQRWLYSSLTTPSEGWLTVTFFFFFFFAKKQIIVISSFPGCVVSILYISAAWCTCSCSVYRFTLLPVVYERPTGMWFGVFRIAFPS